MPYLRIRLNEPALDFRVSQSSEEWELWFGGKSVRDAEDERTFTVKSGENNYDAFGAAVGVYISKRPPRAELAKIPADKPWDSADKHRDTIIVSCPESDDEALSFEISISLPADAYQRVMDADWAKHDLILLVELSITNGPEGPVLQYGNHYDANEIEWLADKQKYLFLDDVIVHFLAPPTPIAASIENAEALADGEQAPVPLEQQMLASIERATKSIRELRGTAITAAWLLAAVIILAAFIS